VATACRYNLLRKGLRKIVERRTNRSAGRWRRGKAADQRHQRGPYQFLKQRLLVFEVQVDRPFGDASSLGDIVQSCRGESASDEFIQSSIDDRLAPFRRPCRAAGL